MTEGESVKIEGDIIEALPGSQFRVRLDDGREVLAYISGKMRKHYVRILLGDRVALEISLSDTSRGRITSRLRKKISSPVETSSVDQLAGDSTTDAPPPEKKKKGKG